MLFCAIFIQLIAIWRHIEANLDEFVYLQVGGNASEGVPASTIIGTQNQSWDGERCYAFRGIPYVKPPVRELRFKDPEPFPRLPPRIDARYEGNDCPSIYATNASEHCLTLNIYTKTVSPNELMPVLVFIHPGGLYVGSSLSSFIEPEYLLSEKMVLVTFNYRLSTLGYMDLHTAEVPGNAGFKDQVHALRWVRQHIKHFGGDAEQVTLMGYSAGGLSVSLHLVSPMSAGLFQKAIIMSGSMPPQVKLNPGKQLALALRQAKVLKCTLPADDDVGPADIFSCLRSVEATTIAATLRQMFDFGKDNPMYPWLPSIEPDFGQQRFLDADYYATLASRAPHKMPLLIGFTNGEFCTSALEILTNATLVREFYENFDDLAPNIFMYAGQSKASEITKAIREKYFTVERGDAAEFQQLCDLFSDALIRFGAERLANLTASHNSVFTYRFEYRGEHTNLPHLQGEARVEHLDDLAYLFRMSPHYIAPDDKDAKMVRLYVNFIYHFMVHGHPPGAANARYPDNFALIKDTLSYESGVYFKNAKFWNEILELLD